MNFHYIYSNRKANCSPCESSNKKNCRLIQLREIYREKRKIFDSLNIYRNYAILDIGAHLYERMCFEILSKPIKSTTNVLYHKQIVFLAFVHCRKNETDFFLLNFGQFFLIRIPLDYAHFCLDTVALEYVFSL